MTDETNIQIRERLTALESTCSELGKRLDRIEVLVESVQRMTVEMQHMREDINRMSAGLSELEEEPAKHWETVVSAIIGAAAGSLGAAVMALIFGG